MLKHSKYNRMLYAETGIIDAAALSSPPAEDGILADIPICIKKPHAAEAAMQLFVSSLAFNERLEAGGRRRRELRGLSHC